MSKLAFRFLFLVVALSTVPVVSTPSTAQNKEEEDPSRAFLKTLRLTLDKRDGLNKAVALADTELGARWCQSDKLDDMSVKLVAELTWLARRARRPITGLDCASIGVSRLTSSEQAMKQTATPRLISSMLYESSLMVGRLTDSEIGMIYESREPSLISLNVSDFTLAEAVASDCSGSGLVFLEGMELGALFLDVLMPMVKKKMGEEAFDGARFLKEAKKKDFDALRRALARQLRASAFAVYPSRTLAGAMHRKKEEVKAPDLLAFSNVKLEELSDKKARAWRKATRDGVQSFTCHDATRVDLLTPVDLKECEWDFVLVVGSKKKLEHHVFMTGVEYQGAGSDCGGYGAMGDFAHMECASSKHKSFLVSASDEGYINGTCGPVGWGGVKELACEVGEAGEMSCIKLSKGLGARRDKRSKEYVLEVSKALPEEVREAMSALDGLTPLQAAPKLGDVRKKIDALYVPEAFEAQKK